MLDRERCIQCGRCVRFQDEIVDDPVIGFSQRGRSLEIVSFSEPGFDSIWSGNTTDICPVGALTTMDFRFRARPWELRYSASICNQCPVGCNLTLNIRREAVSGGKWVVKRVMPRQNEMVNETWICDKVVLGIIAHRSPGVETAGTRGGRLEPASWDRRSPSWRNASSERARSAALAGGRSNEPVQLEKLTAGLGGRLCTLWRAISSQISLAPGPISAI
jgi:NADH-quinone oxidoreductase subunit G